MLTLLSQFLYNKIIVSRKVLFYNFCVSSGFFWKGGYIGDKQRATITLDETILNEKLAGTNQWAFSITMNYRATYFRSESSIIITAVGTHKEVL